MRLGKNDRVICRGAENPKVKTLCDDYRGVLDRIEQRKSFLVKQAKDIATEGNSEAKKFFTALKIALRADGVLPENWDSSERANLHFDAQSDLIYTKDETQSNFGHPFLDALFED